MRNLKSSSSAGTHSRLAAVKKDISPFNIFNTSLSANKKSDRAPARQHKLLEQCRALPPGRADGQAEKKLQTGRSPPGQDAPGLPVYV